MAASSSSEHAGDDLGNRATPLSGTQLGRIDVARIAADPRRWFPGTAWSAIKRIPLTPVCTASCDPRTRVPMSPVLWICLMLRRQALRGTVQLVGSVFRRKMLEAGPRCPMRRTRAPGRSANVDERVVNPSHVVGVPGRALPPPFGVNCRRTAPTMRPSVIQRGWDSTSTQEQVSPAAGPVPPALDGFRASRHSSAQGLSPSSRLAGRWTRSIRYAATEAVTPPTTPMPRTIRTTAPRRP